MIFDQKPLREITEADLRAEIAAGLTEHLYLEYKQENYRQNDAGRKEFLLDICQFANADGGFVFIGVPEVREGGHATGVPDPDGQLGIEVENPENALLRFDAQIAANIQERLRVESCVISIPGGRVVLAFRIPDSTSKPHCVKLQGEHLYFPMRRERHRVYLNVRDVKEMAMRTASQLEKSRVTLEQSLLNERSTVQRVRFLIGLIPVFFKEFLIDIRESAVNRSMIVFDVRTMRNDFGRVFFSFEGLVRDSGNGDRVTLGRNGLIKSNSDLTFREEGGARLHCAPNWADYRLRNFMLRAQTLTQATGIEGPFLLKVAIHSPLALVAYGPSVIPGTDEVVGRLNSGYWPVPDVQLTGIGDPVPPLIKPICDYVHQMFGCEGSPSFDANGNWVERRW